MILSAGLKQVKEDGWMEVESGHCGCKVMSLWFHQQQQFKYYSLKPNLSNLLLFSVALLKHFSYTFVSTETVGTSSTSAALSEAEFILLPLPQ